MPDIVKAHIIYLEGNSSGVSFDPYQPKARNAISISQDGFHELGGTLSKATSVNLNNNNLTFSGLGNIVFPRLEVVDDINISTKGKGIIIKDSANNDIYRLSIKNGKLVIDKQIVI